MNASMVPRYHSGALKSISKRDMATRFPALFSLTIERNGWLCRYTSDEPSFAMAEAWVARVLKQNEGQQSPTSWCVLVPHGEDTVLFVSVYQEVVQKAYVCLSAQLQLDELILQRCEKVFITDQLLLKHLVHDLNCEVVAPLTHDELSTFALKKETSHVPLAAVMCAIFGVALGGWWLFSTPPAPPPPPPVVQVVVDPYDAYRDALNRTVDAAPVLTNAVALGAYGVLLPHEWPLTSIDFSQGQLTLNTSRTTLGKHSVLTAWLEGNPELNRKGITYTVHSDAFALLAATPVTLVRWQGSMADASAITNPLRDALIALGWEVKLSPLDVPAMPYASPLSLSKADTTLAELASVAEMVSSIPVGLGSLSMKPSTQGRYTIELTLYAFGS